MSKRINVNPGQYKVAGRERMGENLTQANDKQALGQSRSELQRRTRKPVRQAPPKRGAGR
jgi:hypothetical protein